jgi:hypothetical protein
MAMELSRASQMAFFHGFPLVYLPSVVAKGLSALVILLAAINPTDMLLLCRSQIFHHLPLSNLIIK